MAWTRENVLEALRGPLSGRAVWASACDGAIGIRVEAAGTSDDAGFDRDASAARRTLEAAAARDKEPLTSIVVEFVDAHGAVVSTRKFGAPGAAEGHRPIGGLRDRPAQAGTVAGIPGVKRVIAVGAGKGGVGKSTVALNLAVGLARRGHAVGLLDGDIYGPSMPTMLGLASLDTNVRAGMLQPFYVHGVKCMTIGKLVDADKPLIWRGPMAHGAFKQLAEQTEWGELDYLVIDLPPGTGDVSLTMAQLLTLTGAVVVCTPQRVAQDDAVRAAAMFRQLGVPVLGVVENMSFFVGDDGKVYDLFGRGGAEVMAQRLSLPFLGAIPITTALRVNSDAGDPTSNFTGRDEAGKRLAEALDRVVANVESQVALQSLTSGAQRPTLTIS